MAGWSARPDKRLLDPRRVRRIRDGFSWIDRRFIRDGWAERLSREAVLLYLFLVAVADKDGLSFWGDVRVAGTLKVPIDEIDRAREELVRAGLVAYERPLYQVLDLRPAPAAPREGAATSVGEILRQLAARGGR
jgi:hypothetical protein